MEKFLDLRRKVAKLLGYPTWADYITEVKMAKSAKGVKEVRMRPPLLVCSALTGVLSARHHSS